MCLWFVATAVGGGGGSHWKYERIFTVAMVGLIPAGLIYPNPVVDYGLAITLPLHGHWLVAITTLLHYVMITR